MGVLLRRVLRRGSGGSGGRSRCIEWRWGRDVVCKVLLEVFEQ